MAPRLGGALDEESIHVVEAQKDKVLTTLVPEADKMAKQMISASKDHMDSCYSKAGYGEKAFKVAMALRFLEHQRSHCTDRALDVIPMLLPKVPARRLCQLIRRNEEEEKER